MIQSFCVKIKTNSITYFVMKQNKTILIITDNIQLTN